MEDQHKRAGVSSDARPRQQGEQYGQRTHIEDQNTVDNLISGFGNALLRIVCFSGGDPHQLQTTEGEHDDRHHHHQPRHAVRQEAALFPEVANGCLWATVAAEQQPAAKDDHRHHGNHFNNRKPELHFTEHFYVGQVNGVDNDEEGRRGGPGWDLGVPELNVFSDGGKLGHRNQHVQYPVVPARGETGETAPVLVCKMAERARHWLFNDHFTQLTHNQKGDKACDGVPQNNAWTG